MSNNSQPILVNTLINKWNENSSMFSALPEFSFIPPLAQKIKAKGCTCGLGGEIAATTASFNAIVKDLNEEAVQRMKALFQTNKICFAIQTASNFEVKCY